MKMYKRIFAFAIAAAMMAGTMLGCGQSGASGNTGIGGRSGRNDGNRDSRSTCWGCY